MLDRSATLIDSQPALEAVLEQIGVATALAVDIETVNWWDREAERVALVQLAYRDEVGPQVAIIDVFSGLDIEPLRKPLEVSPVIKAIHNASFDAIRIARYFNIHTSPIHDTMLAARRSGERRWSLKAQVEAHLGILLDKQEQRSDWSRRPLASEQLRYAALDASCTLLLYEHQVKLGLRGEYTLKKPAESRPVGLPFEPSSVHLLVQTTALLGIVVELSGRYSPEQLAASVGYDRVGLAGWIVDRAIGSEADIDEETARLEIARLREEGLVALNGTRRLEATPRGIEVWSGQNRPL